MKSCRELPEKLSIDSSVAIAYLLGERLSDAAECVLFSDRQLYMAETALAEIYYVACRLRGAETARRLVAAIREVGLEPPPRGIHEKAGEIKCRRAISLADSYVIALAELVGGAAVFARRERELVREAEERPFNVEIVFLEDLLPRGRGGVRADK